MKLTRRFNKISNKYLKSIICVDMLKGLDMSQQVKMCSRKDKCSNPLRDTFGFLSISEFKYKAKWCDYCKRTTAIKYYSAHVEKMKAYSKEYARINAEKIRLYPSSARLYKNKRQAKYIKNRCKSDIQFRIRTNLRNKLSETIHRFNINKSFTSFQLLGMSIPDFQLYIEKMFQPGMSWDNWGKRTWHLDHIIPLASFDLTDLKQQEKAFNYTNLQPLWAQENLAKGDKLGYVVPNKKFRQNV